MALMPAAGRVKPGDTVIEASGGSTRIAMVLALERYFTTELFGPFRT